MNIAKMNMVTKDKFMETLKKECVLIIALLLAFITSFIYTPKIEYIDFKTLILLFNLLIIVSGLKELKVLDYIAVKITSKCTSSRKLAISLVFITFAFSMIVTNDVALITFVPITLIIGEKLNLDILKIVIFQTLAANLGSSLTPMGNPQNLFLYTYYNISPNYFFKLMGPIALIAVIFLICLIIRNKNVSIKVNLKEIKIENRKKIYVYSFLLFIVLLSVFHVIDYRIPFIITTLVIALLDRNLFGKVDYSLLVTFIGFFIFVGNISNSPVIESFMENMLNDESKTYFTGIIASQFISNVPASMLLSGFTSHFKELLLGVNIGGMGTLIASMASVISYKLYCNQAEGNGTKYLKLFTYYNVIGLILFSIIVKICLSI